MYEFKILFEISKVAFESSHKILNPYTAKYAFYDVLKKWRLMISYDVLGPSEMGPWTPPPKKKVVLMGATPPVRFTIIEMS